MTPARGERWPWAKLGRTFTHAQAMNPKCPDWQRVAFAAWARVTRQGIATFAPGELAEAAAKLDPVTGELVPLSNARRALRDAIQHGWLAAGSDTETVQVPLEVLSVGG